MYEFLFLYNSDENSNNSFIISTLRDYAAELRVNLLAGQAHRGVSWGAPGAADVA